ncbi:MAG: hypothetical protein QOE93_1848 [Actinomycetota bacterium]|nr:hypothetical protein [Actinomycetota bacterium]
MVAVGEVGVGAVEALAGAGGAPGRVVARFAKAAYVQVGDGLVAVTRPGVARGPIHLVAALPAGDEVVFDLGRARVWRGPLPPPPALAASAGAIVTALAAAPASSLHDPVYAPRMTTALAALAGDDLDAVAAALGGLGPGLTPAGDDALAGILMARRARRGAVVEDDLVAVADTVRTNALARAFLLWAGRGQCIEPVHDLLMSDDVAGATRAVTALAAVGHSSGADLAWGLRVGLVSPA